MSEELMSGRLGGMRDEQRLLSGSAREILLQYLVITVGAAIFGLAVTLFMIPHKIAPGGVSGIVVVLNSLFKWPAGALLFAFNVPIFILGLKFLGASFGMKSLYGTIMLSVFTDLFNEILHLKVTIADPILAPVFGGVVMGVGLGLIIKMGGATSGSGTIARILARKTNLTQGTAILLINTLVVGMAGLAFKSADLAMYGLLSLWVSSKVTDVIIEGMDYARGVYVITSHVEQVSDVILNKLDRGGTALQGRGLYTNTEREILFCVLTRKEVSDLIGMVKRIDPKAFVIISPVHEVLGEGFRRRV